MLDKAIDIGEDRQPEPSDPKKQNQNETPSKTTSLDGVFSDMYDRLVSDPDDLPGMIAYGFYQLEKREWARAYLVSHGKPPSNEAARDFLSRYQASAMRSLKERADGILYRYAFEYETEQAAAWQGKAFNERAVVESPNYRTA